MEANQLHIWISLAVAGEANTPTEFCTWNIDTTTAAPPCAAFFATTLLTKCITASGAGGLEHRKST